MSNINTSEMELNVRFSKRVYQAFIQAQLELSVWFRHYVIFTNALAASKNIIHLRIGQKWPKNNTLASFNKIKPKAQRYKLFLLRPYQNDYGN